MPKVGALVHEVGREMSQLHMDGQPRSRGGRLRVQSQGTAEQSGEGAQECRGGTDSCRGSRSSVPSLPDQGQMVLSEMILSGKPPEALSFSLCLPTHHPEA